MLTYSIPPERWRAALDELSVSRRTWPVSVEIVSADLGAQPEVLELPLEGISVSEAGAHPAIAISMTGPTPEHVTHMVENVSALRIQREGAIDRAVEIVGADGTHTILRFSPPTIH
jgi:hypothetical protein